VIYQLIYSHRKEPFRTSFLARQEGLEPPTTSLEGWRSIHLSYWRLPPQ
jgi:hypothetical protein